MASGRARTIGLRGREYMWEIIGYVVVALACFACALVLASAFDDR
jgi:hypothetical protein